MTAQPQWVKQKARDGRPRPIGPWIVDAGVAPALRRFFILGGRPDVARPRYDLRLYGMSPTFGVQDVEKEFRLHGGVLIWRDPRWPVPTTCGEPMIPMDQ